MADFERFDAAAEGGENEQQELERLQKEQESELTIAGTRFSRNIEFQKPATVEAPAKTPEKPPETWTQRTAERAAKQAEKLRQTFEKAALKLLPRTGQRRVEQVSKLAALAKRLGIRFGLADLTQRIAYLRGKGEMPRRTNERLTRAEAKQTEGEEEQREPAEDEIPDFRNLTAEQARDESFGRLDSMRDYVENLAGRKPENLQRMDRVYDLLLKTRNPKFDKWKEAVGIGLSLATIGSTLLIGGSASSLVRTGRMLFGSLNYSTIGFRMGSEWGLAPRVRKAQEAYQALKDWKAGEFPVELPEETLAEMIALYRAGVRFDQYESNRQGLKLFGKAGEVFQGLKQRKFYESGQTLWNAVIEDRKELLKLGGKMLFYSTPLIAAGFAPALAVPLYAGTTGLGAFEGLIRIRRANVKEKAERERTEPDALLKQITEFADRYKDNLAEFRKFGAARAAEIFGEDMEEVINRNVESISTLADEKYLEIQRTRGAKGLKVGAILGAISASFYGIMSHRSPAAAHDQAPSKPGGAGAGGAAGALTPREGASGEQQVPSGPGRAPGGASSEPGASAPDRGPRAGMAPESPAAVVPPGTEASREAEPPGTPPLTSEQREWANFAKKNPLVIESNPHDFQAALAAHRQLEQLKPGEQLTEKFSWFHNGKQFEVGGIRSNGKFFLDGQEFDIVNEHYIKVPIDVNPDGIIDQHDLVNGERLDALIDIRTGRTDNGAIAAWDKDIFFGKSHENIGLVASNRARLDEHGVSIGRDEAGKLHITHEATGGKPGLDPESFKAYLGGAEVAHGKLDKPLFEYKWRFDHYVVHKGAADPYLDLAHQRALLDVANYRVDDAGYAHYTGAPTEQALADKLREAVGSNTSFKEAFEQGQVGKGLLDTMLEGQPAGTPAGELPILTNEKPSVELSAGQKNRVLETLKQFLTGYTGERKKIIEDMLARPDRQFILERHADSTLWLRPSGSAPLRFDDLAGLRPLVDRLTSK